MSDEERDKKFDYIEKTFNESLFDEKSPEYCGISKNEFQGSLLILKHIDKLLNEKEKSTSQKEGAEEKKSPMRWLGYAWTVIVNLITIGVVLAIYGKVSADFEVIVVSILILTYLSIQSFSMIYGKTITATAFGLDNEFKRLRKLLKDEPRNDELEEIKEAKKKVDNSMIKMYINAGFLFIIYLIALFHLFGSL
jgi:pheromone shutdown protein TraB